MRDRLKQLGWGEAQANAEGIMFIGAVIISPAGLWPETQNPDDRRTNCSPMKGVLSLVNSNPKKNANNGCLTQHPKL